MPGAEKCFLRCCKGLHPDILLAHQVKITVGRGPNTKIKDKRCSRDQISLVADYKKLEVRLTQLGLNVGKFQDKELSKGQAVNLRHGDTFDILSGEYQHKIFFDPAPSKENMNTEPESESAETPAKRKTTPPSPEASKAKQPKLETKKSEVQIKKLDRSSGNILWEEGAGGQIYIMTYGDCKPSEKARFHFPRKPMKGNIFYFIPFYVSDSLV